MSDAQTTAAVSTPRRFVARTAPVLAGIFVLVGTGVASGLFTDRWRTSDDVADAVRRLDKVATTLGDWESKPEPLDAKVLKIGGIAGYLQRTYTHRRSGAMATVLVVCGRPGPISVHTPDACYQAQGFVPDGPARTEPIPLPGGRPPASFFVGNFARESAKGLERLRVFWSWKPRSGWRAVDDPRIAFVRERALYKVYFIRPIRATAEPLADDPCVVLMGALLPEFDRALDKPADSRDS
jgi:hypothetical protein